MKAQDIYHRMRAIAEDYHAYTDQLTAIAKWIEAEFEYKPKKLANRTNTSERQLTIPAVSGQSELLLAFVEHIKKDNELTETVNANDVDAFLKSQQ
jgi:hypothetical protein